MIEKNRVQQDVPQDPEDYRAASGTGDPNRDRPEGGPVQVDDDTD
jgi:hypothetical protein